MKETPALETTGLGKRFGNQWALRECSLSLPAGSVAALVGPNGAGKSTLLHLAVGLISPTVGEITILGDSPFHHPERALARVGFVAQDHPLYRRFTVADMLHFGRKLNPKWDEPFARSRLDRLGIPLDRPTGKLSGGQQAQVALVLALAKRPDLVLLDEPLASLDPLARREFLQTLMEAAAEHGLTVLLSSHNLSDLERVCDYLVLIAGGRVQLAGDVERIIAVHKRLTGPRADSAEIGRRPDVILADHAERQTSMMVRANGHLYDPSWTVHDTDLEEIVLAYLARRPADEPIVLDQIKTEVVG